MKNAPEGRAARAETSLLIKLYLIIINAIMQMCNVLIGVTVVIALVPRFLRLLILVLYRTVAYTFVAPVYPFQRFVIFVNVRDCCRVTGFFTIER